MTGSDVRRCARAERAAERGALADAVSQVGAGALPVVTVDGAPPAPRWACSRARCGVVTERTRLALPGPTFGFVPSRSPPSSWRQLPASAPTWRSPAPRSRRELVTLDLATHITESQALPRVEAELAQWMSARRGAGAAAARRLVDETCVAPPPRRPSSTTATRCTSRPRSAGASASRRSRWRRHRGGGGRHAGALERLRRRRRSPCTSRSSCFAARHLDWREVAPSRRRSPPPRAPPTSARGSAAARAGARSSPTRPTPTTARRRPTATTRRRPAVGGREPRRGGRGGDRLYLP